MSAARDVVIVGGGVVGSSIAWHLRRDGHRGRVTVVERDPTYVRASSYLATGGIRQQYGSALNVAMARYSVAFYAAFDETMARAGRSPEVWFRQRGYLFLAAAANAERLARRYELQRRSGATVERWTPAQIAARVPGLDTSDLEFGVFGPDDGYLNPRKVLAGFRGAAEDAGAEYLEGEVLAIERDAARVKGVVIATSNGNLARFADVVIDAAGAYSARVARLAGIALPIEPVRQHLFRCELETPLPYRLPMIFDPDGTHWRHDDPTEPGQPDRIIIGRSRPDEPPGENFLCDWSRWERELAPTLRRRLPALSGAEPVEGWAGLYEMTPDHNALIGEHPQLEGFYVAAGFSGHGLMMAPATGRIVSELVRTRSCSAFDVAPLAIDRFERGAFFHDDALI